MVEYLGPKTEQNIFLKFFFFLNCCILKGQLSPWQEQRLLHFIATSLTYTSCTQEAADPGQSLPGAMRVVKEQQTPKASCRTTAAQYGWHIPASSFLSKQTLSFFPTMVDLHGVASEQMGQKPASTYNPIISCTLTQLESSVSN